MAGPVVPRVSQNQVQISAGNQGRQQFAQDSGAFGINGEPIARGVSQAAELYDKAQQSANKTLAMSGDRQLSAWETEALYGPNGAFQKRGKDAFGTIQEVNEGYQKKVSDIAASLNGSAKTMFETSAQQRYGDIARNLNKHVAAQSQVYQDNEDDAYVITERNAAIANPTDTLRIEASLARQVETIASKAERNGIGPEQTKQAIMDVQSKTNYGIVKSLVDANQDIYAKDYFEKNKHMLQGEELLHAEKLVRAGSVQGEAMRTADSFMAKGMSIQQQLNETQKISDPDVRKATQDQIRMNKSNKDMADRDLAERINKDVASKIDRGIKWTDIPQSTKDALTSSERTSLQNYAQERERGIQPKTDWNTWTELTQMASDPAARDKFNQLNLVKYRPYLADAQYMDMVNKQVGTRSGNDKVFKELDGVRSDNQIIDQTAAAVGIVFDKNDESGTKKYNSYRQAVDTEYQKFISDNGRKPKNDELQAIVDGLLIKKSNGFFDFGSTRRFELKEGEDFYSDISSVNDIPSSVLTEIRASNAYKKKPSNETIMRLFKALVDKNGK